MNMLYDVEVSLTPFTVTVDADSKETAEATVKQMIRDDEGDLPFMISTNIYCDVIEG